MNQHRHLPDYDFIELEGHKLHLRRAGEPGAPRVLLLGAWPQSIHGWDGLVSLLEPSCEVLALDLPGFGRSQGEPGLMRPSAQASFLARVLRQLDFTHAHGVFPDVAVPVGLTLLCDAPDLMRAATLANGPTRYPLSGSTSLRALVASSAARWALSLTPDLFVDGALRSGYRHFRPDPARIETYKACYRQGRLDATFAYLASYPTELPALVRRVPSIRTQLSVLWGEHDPFLSIENAMWLVEQVRHTELVRLDAGHFSHEDAPAAFATHILGLEKR